MEQIQQQTFPSNFIPKYPEPDLLQCLKKDEEVLMVQKSGRTEVFDIYTNQNIDPINEVRRFTAVAHDRAVFMVGNIGAKGGLFRFIKRPEAFGIIEQWVMGCDDDGM